jgi:hypothetical protein
MTDADRTFRYDPARLTWLWSDFHQRHGVMHPAPPGMLLLHSALLFMGWTMDDARQCCDDANIERATWIAAQGDTPS